MLKKTLVTLLFLMISLSALAVEVQKPSAWTREDDMRCVQSASWAMVTQTAKGEGGVYQISKDFADVPNIFYFFLGRLSALDSSKNWIEISKRDLMDNRKTEDFYYKKFTECRNVMAARVKGK